MSRFDRFTAEELMIIKWALYIVINDYGYNESENKIAKSLYKSIKECLKEKKND